MAANTISDEALDCAISIKPFASSTQRGSEPGSMTVHENEYVHHFRIRDQSEAKVLEAMMPSLETFVRVHTAKVRLRKIEELVEILAVNIVAPSDIDVSMAHRLGVRRARLLKEFGWTTAKELAAANRSRAANRHALADNWKKRRMVFSVLHRDTKKGLHEVFPLFQFEDHRPIKAVREIIEAFGEGKLPWNLALWFTSNNGWLPNQARPVDLLSSLPNAVIEAARRDAGGSAA